MNLTVEAFQSAGFLSKSEPHPDLDESYDCSFHKWHFNQRLKKFEGKNGNKEKKIPTPLASNHLPLNLKERIIITFVFYSPLYLEIEFIKKCAIMK